MTCFERTLPIHQGKYATGLPWEDDMPVRVKQSRLVWRMLTGARVQHSESLTVHLIASLHCGTVGRLTTHLYHYHEMPFVPFRSNKSRRYMIYDGHLDAVPVSTRGSA